MPLDGCPGFPPKRAALYERRRWWLGLTLGDVLDRASDCYPGREALVAGAIRLTYHALREVVDLAALGFRALGIEPGDRVLLQFPNLPEFVIAHLGLQKVGAVSVMCSPRYAAREIEHFARLTGAAAWCLPARFGKTDYGPLVEQLRRAGAAPKHVIVVGADPLPGTVSFDRLVREGGAVAGGRELLEALRPDPREVCHLMPTGGTTGLPKLVPRTHNDYLCNAEFRARAWERAPQDTALIATPLTHNMALEVLLFPTLLTGGRLVILPSTDAASILEAISQERVTTTILVPAQLVDLVAAPELERWDHRTLRSLAGAGAKVPADLVRKVRERFGVLFFNVFGMAEGPCAMTRPGDPPEVVEQTVGHPICPYDEFRIVDDDGRPLPPGEEGELAARGPGVFCGYYKDAAKNREVFTEQEFFRTGDLARLARTGRLIIAGRKKDVIIRGGENISASEVEELLMAHPQVAHAAVVGLPDPRLGERVCAYVQPVPGARPTLEAIRRFLSERGVSVLYHPERLELLETLPLTNVGKVDKAALRADLEVRLRREAQH